MSKVLYKSLDFMGYPNYRVGTDGSIWSRNARLGRGSGKWAIGDWKRFKHTKDTDGYPMALLSSNSKRRIFKVHRLVLLAFVGPCPDGMEGCHFPNPDPSDNRLENLRWASRKENARDRDIHGRTARGSRSGVAKLTEEKVRQIRKLHDAGLFTKKELAHKYEVSRANIQLITSRKHWKHVT